MAAWLYVPDGAVLSPHGKVSAPCLTRSAAASFFSKHLVFVAEGLAEFLPISSAGHFITPAMPPNPPDLFARRA
jgi:hypothetical protein